MIHSLSFFFFLVILFLAAVDADIVNETCLKASQNDKNLHYDFCVAALRKDPKSHRVDIQGLGIISVELIQANGTKIFSCIDELLHDKNVVVDVKTRLEDCKELYSDALSRVKDVIVAFKFKDYKTANIKLSSMMDASSNCEDGFKEKPGLRSPLSTEDIDFF